VLLIGVPERNLEREREKERGRERERERNKANARGERARETAIILEEK
jgi:hypothetical protein